MNVKFNRDGQSYQREEHQEPGNIAEHSAQWDLERSEYLEGGHEVCRTGDTENISNGEQNIRHDFRIIWFPIGAH